MNRIVVHDSGPLGLLTSPPGKKGNAAICAEWLASLLAGGARVIVPEIADYEVRRELLRATKAKSVARLDALGEGRFVLDYLGNYSAPDFGAPNRYYLSKREGFTLGGRNRLRLSSDEVFPAGACRRGN